MVSETFEKYVTASESLVIKHVNQDSPFVVYGSWLCFAVALLCCYKNSNQIVFIVCVQCHLKTRAVPTSASQYKYVWSAKNIDVRQINS